MIRFVLGWILVGAAAVVWLADMSVSERAAASAVYAVPALPLLYYGRRARRRGKTAVQHGTTPGDVAGIRDKIARGASPKERNKALNKACFNGHVDVARELLASGVDVNAMSMLETPLESAIRGGHPEIVELLLDHGAALSGREHERPLLVAVQKGSYDVVALLLRCGADVNAATDKGMTPLIWAAATSGDPKLVRMLLEGGADPDLEDEFGYTALASVAGNLMLGKKPDVAVELIDGGAAMSGRIFPHKASILGGVDRDHPIQWATATEMRDKHGNTLLMIAAAAGRRRAVSRLLPHVPVNAVNKSGEDAVTLAEAAGHTDISGELRQARQSSVHA